MALWVYQNKIPIYTIFYLLKGGEKALGPNDKEFQSTVHWPILVTRKLTLRLLGSIVPLG